MRQISSRLDEHMIFFDGEFQSLIAPLLRKLITEPVINSLSDVYGGD
jgi:hypothetical protein